MQKIHCVGWMAVGVLLMVFSIVQFVQFIGTIWSVPDQKISMEAGALVAIKYSVGAAIGISVAAIQFKVLRR